MQTRIHNLPKFIYLSLIFPSMKVRRSQLYELFFNNIITDPEKPQQVLQKDEALPPPKDVKQINSFIEEFKAFDQLMWVEFQNQYQHQDQVIKRVKQEAETEFWEFSLNQTEFLKKMYESIIDQIRLSNATQLKNLSTRYKGLLEDFFQSKTSQLQQHFQQQSQQMLENFYQLKNQIILKDQQMQPQIHRILRKYLSDMLLTQEGLLSNVSQIKNFELLSKTITQRKNQQSEKLSKKLRNYQKLEVQFQVDQQKLLQDNQELLLELENLKKKDVKTYFSMGNQKMSFGKGGSMPRSNYLNYRSESSADKINKVQGKQLSDIYSPIELETTNKMLKAQIHNNRQEYSTQMQEKDQLINQMRDQVLRLQAKLKTTDEQMASLIKENEIFKSQSNPSKNFKALNEFLLNANKQNQPKFDLKQSQEKFNHFTTNDMKTLKQTDESPIRNYSFQVIRLNRQRSLSQQNQSIRQ